MLPERWIFDDADDSDGGPLILRLADWRVPSVLALEIEIHANAKGRSLAFWILSESGHVLRMQRGWLA